MTLNPNILGKAMKDCESIQDEIRRLIDIAPGGRFKSHLIAAAGEANQLYSHLSLAGRFLVNNKKSKPNALDPYVGALVAALETLDDQIESQTHLISARIYANTEKRKASIGNILVMKSPAERHEAIDTALKEALGKF